VWLRCSKIDFTSVKTVQITVNLAHTSLNRGANSFVSFLERLGVTPGPHCATHFHKCDVFRIKRSEKKRSAVEKKKRKAESRHKALVQEQMFVRLPECLVVGVYRARSDPGSTLSLVGNAVSMMIS